MPGPKFPKDRSFKIIQGGGGGGGPFPKSKKAKAEKLTRQLELKKRVDNIKKSTKEATDTLDRISKAIDEQKDRVLNKDLPEFFKSVELEARKEMMRNPERMAEIMRKSDMDMRKMFKRDAALGAGALAVPATLIGVGVNEGKKAEKAKKELKKRKLERAKRMLKDI